MQLVKKTQPGSRRLWCNACVDSPVEGARPVWWSRTSTRGSIIYNCKKSWRRQYSLRVRIVFKSLFSLMKLADLQIALVTYFGKMFRNHKCAQVYIHFFQGAVCVAQLVKKDDRCHGLIFPPCSDFRKRAPDD